MINPEGSSVPYVVDEKKIHSLISMNSGQLNRLDLDKKVESFHEIGLIDPLNSKSIDKAFKFISDSTFLPAP